ncbi:MAG: FecCD family ABC transporter permease [Opitutales bacterium]
MTKAVAEAFPRPNLLRRHRVGVIGVMGLVSLLLALLGFAYGEVSIALTDQLKVLGAQFGLAQLPADVGPIYEAVLLDIRLPRVVLAFAVGGALAVSGASMQGLFRNPLADPGLIGVSAGAAAGALLFFVFGAQWFASIGLGERWGLPLFAIVGACLTTFAIYSLSLVEGRSHIATLLLTGLAVNAFASAFVGLLIFGASDAQIRSFTFWTLGSLANANWSMLAVGVPAILILSALLLAFSRGLNALLLGEAEAHHLGMNVHRLKRALVLLSAGAVAVTVSLCGVIGFVGLIVPHLVRLAIGPDHRYLLPAAALLGGALLLGSDFVARHAVANAELPIGAVTAAIGAPFFLFLLHQAKRQAAAA